MTPKPERATTAGDPPPAVEISEEHLLYKPEVAEEEGLTGREPRADDLIAALSHDATITGPELRAVLEEATNREPRKGQVTELLARSAEGGEAAKVVVVIGKPEPGTKAATPSEIRKASLDGMTVLSPADAQRLSIAPPEGPTKVKPAKAEGSAGQAFQRIVDQVGDSPADGVRTLSVEARADPDEGVRDIALLGKAVGQLPKHELLAVMDIEMDFKGLKPGVAISLTGSAAAYQKIEDALLALGKKAGDFQGTLRIDVDFTEPVDTSAAEFEQVRKVVTDLSPGEIRLTAVLE